MQVVQQHGGQAQQGPQEPLRRRISGFLARTIQRFRIALLVIIIAAAAFLLGYVVYSEINKKLVSDATTLAEAAQASFDTWTAETDTAKKATIEKDLRDRLDKLIDRYPRQYGGQRGLFVRADMSFESKSWDAAITDYETLASRFPNSYLAPMSLFNAAVCAEEKGDLLEAARLYSRVYGSYKDSTVAPRAMFDAGRVAEARGLWSEAQTAYEGMDSSYGQSIWTKLAKNRLVDLKVQGKIK